MSRGSNETPSWLRDAQANLASRARQGTSLSPELQARELSGVRVFVATRESTGAKAPLTVVHGRDYPTYAAFMDAVDAVHREFAENHGPGKDGLTVQDYWAESVEAFQQARPLFFA